MEFWFSELHSPHVKFDIRVEKQLFSGESDYQRIDVFQSPEFGKFLTLNGSVIFSEQDCFIYNEMVVHVPMSVHPDVKNVLIIGGGDGGVSKELLQYDNIENIDIVEQDNMFVDVCREYFPETAVGLEDGRVHIYNSDALRFLRSKQDMYDLIMTQQTRLVRVRDCLQGNSMVTVIRHLRRTEYLCTSMEVRSMMRMRMRAEACTERYSIHFQ